MMRVLKPIRVLLALVALVALSACSLGGQTAAATATTVDVRSVMTSAAATAFVQLTQIAGQASATVAPSQTPEPAAASDTPSGPTITPGGPTITPQAGLQLVTATEGAGGLPVVETAAVTPGAPALTPGLIPSFTPLVPPVSSGGSNVSTCTNSKFAGDITIPDGTVMTPGQKFTKIWAVQNTGTCSWDQGFGITIWAGPSMNGSPTYFSAKDAPVQPGGTVDMSIEMRAPYQKGDYVAHWIMISDTGKTFGGDLTVVIKVQ